MALVAVAVSGEAMILLGRRIPISIIEKEEENRKLYCSRLELSQALLRRYCRPLPWDVLWVVLDGLSGCFLRDDVHLPSMLSGIVGESSFALFDVIHSLLWPFCDVVSGVWLFADSK